MTYSLQVEVDSKESVHHTLIDNEDMLLEIELLDDLVALHWFPHVWGVGAYKRYKEIFEYIKVRVAELGYTKITQPIHKDSSKQRQLLKMFGFKEVRTVQDYIIFEAEV